MNIDHNSKVPLYFQLKEELKRSILSGVFQEGDLLPSERELNQRFNLSSTTIRRAFNELVHESLLERKPGKGTFVSPRKVTRDLRKVIGFTQNIREMGLQPSTRVLAKRIVNATAEVRDQLKLAKGTKIFRLSRLRLADGMPMMVETRYIRLDLCPDIIRQDLARSLWQVFERAYGLKPNRHTQRVQIARLKDKTADLLELKQDALAFLIKGVTYVADNNPIECEDSYYRSDKYDLAFDAFIDS